MCRPLPLYLTLFKAICVRQKAVEKLVYWLVFMMQVLEIKNWAQV